MTHDKVRGLLHEWDGQDPMAVLKRVHDEVRAPLLAARFVAYIDGLDELGGSDDPDVKTVACQRIHVFLMFLVFVVRRISQKKTLSELTCLS